METGAIVAVTLHGADEGDIQTIQETVAEAGERILSPSRPSPDTFTSGLSCVQDLMLVHILRVAGHAIRSFLAGDAARGPRHRGEPLGIDILFAVDTNTKVAAVDTLQGSFDFAQPQGLAIERTHCKIALLGVLNAIQLIPTRFNHDSLAVATSVAQFRAVVLQDFSESLQFTFVHTFRFHVVLGSVGHSALPDMQSELAQQSVA
jgi:hypothetical protein